MPEDVKPQDLDGRVRGELKTLSKENADWVAVHLVMAGRLIDDDPAAAHEHALAASRRAGRVGVVRETVGLTAYAIGDFALALRELRTFRRITGSDDEVPVMVDCERGLGKPEAALELARSVDRATLPASGRVELAIARSGARLDLHDPEAALKELEIPELDPNRAFAYTPRLLFAYADVLTELGRTVEASKWEDRAKAAESALAAATLEDDELDLVDLDIDVIDLGTEETEQ